MTDLSSDQSMALEIAHTLVDLGAPVFCAFPDSLKGGFQLPRAWPEFRPHHRQVEMWRPGCGLAMVTGVVYDVLDIDPRNDGEVGYQALRAMGAVPKIYGVATTPSAGEHLLIPRTRLAKGKAETGVDLQAGDGRGQGRGFVWIAPTVRTSKYGTHKGLDVAYQWQDEPTQTPDNDPEKDPGLRNLIELMQAGRAPRRTATPAPRMVDEDLEAFGDLASDWTADEAWRVIQDQVAAVQSAREGEINNTLGGAARVFGRFVAGGFLPEDEAERWLMNALELGGVHDDAWNVREGKGWTAATVIGAGLANGAQEPWTVEDSVGSTQGIAEASTAAPITESAPSGTSIPGGSVSAAPQLHITSAADMAYQLQNDLGRGPLAGFFLRDGRVVHTPREGESGYVEPRADEDDNGPAQIRAVSAPELSAKIQYLFRCYKETDQKGPDGKKTGARVMVSALFPVEAARRAVDAPEAMHALRPLAGVTHTPMVRRDGSVLEKPGYDPDSRFLFLPEPGVNVPKVPEEPSVFEVERAVGLLDTLLADFPWASAEDRSNYIGLLLTPMLRLVTPPAYKMFGITAHQPGSGKTLLADIATTLHGGVLRSEVPEDEAEWRKQTTGILAGTSAPVVHLDNVTGVLKSSVLAGLLTADKPITDRELGSMRMLTTSNDRVWVLTGNNLSIGGDLVRRTVLIQIDPNMPNPESRTDFRIRDIRGWVRDQRNDLLWALLVMIRRWASAGSPLAQRNQSDSYAAWESTVEGILDACGVAGGFDAQSGQRAATGGDDDGLADVLARLWVVYENRTWHASDAIAGTVSTDIGDMVAESREWLPSVVLDRLARSEAAGRKAFGYWLRNRLGRWVSAPDGCSYVIREAGRDKLAALWRIERA